MFAEDCIKDPVDNVLQFPGGVIDMDNHLNPELKSVFVRPCYPDLFRMSMLDTAGNIKADRFKAFILGTPGCGKSMARMYFLQCLLKLAAAKGATAYVLLEKGNSGCPGSSPVYVLRHRGDKTDILQLSSPENKATLYELVESWQDATDTIVVSLVDVSEGQYDAVAVPVAISVYFSSPNSKLTGKADRCKVWDVEDYFMPLYTLPELQFANQWLKLEIDPAQVVERFHCFGGSARAVLGSEKQRQVVEEELRNGLINRELLEWLRLVIKVDGNLLQPPNEMIHTLVHITTPIEGDGCFQNQEYLWASAQIRDMVVESLLEMVEDPTRITAVMEPGGMKGEVVEHYWLMRFFHAQDARPADRQILVRTMDNKVNRDTANLQSMLLGYKNLQMEYFEHGEMYEVLNRHLGSSAEGDAVLLKPFSSTFKAIDALLVIRWGETSHVLLLQATVRATHPTKNEAALFLGQLVQFIGQRAVPALVFVVPPHRLREFRQQSVHVTTAYATEHQVLEDDAVLEAASNLTQFKMVPASDTGKRTAAPLHQQNDKRSRNG